LAAHIPIAALLGLDALNHQLECVEIVNQHPILVVTHRNECQLDQRSHAKRFAAVAATAEKDFLAQAGWADFAAIPNRQVLQDIAVIRIDSVRQDLALRFLFDDSRNLADESGGLRVGWLENQLQPIFPIAIVTAMPGSPMVGYRTARDLGRTTEDMQRAGEQDFLNALGVYSGNLAPSAGQLMQNNQFNANLGFQRSEANRTYGLRQNEQQLNAAKFNEQYGPRNYSSSFIKPGETSWTEEPGGYWMTDRGQKASGPSALMFKYKY